MTPRELCEARERAESRVGAGLPAEVAAMPPGEAQQRAVRALHDACDDAMMDCADALPGVLDELDQEREARAEIMRRWDQTNDARNEALHEVYGLRRELGRLQGLVAAWQEASRRSDDADERVQCECCASSEDYIEVARSTEAVLGATDALLAYRPASPPQPTPDAPKEAP